MLKEHGIYQSLQKNCLQRNTVSWSVFGSYEKWNNEEVDRKWVQETGRTIASGKARAFKVVNQYLYFACYWILACLYRFYCWSSVCSF